MVRVRFNRDTTHPDIGPISEGAVLSVSAEYARDYKGAGTAAEVDDEEELTNPDGTPRARRGSKKGED